MVNTRSKPQTGSPELLRTKLAIPRLRSAAVSREPLLDSLDNGLEGKLTLLFAPAGFGKTTLISEWAVRLNQRYTSPSVAWVSLDAGDNDPSRFWRYVVAACQIFDAGIGASALAQLKAPRKPMFEVILTALLNELSGLSGRYVLVLEDYNVITEPSIHHALSFMLDHLPTTLHVVIMSRSEPPLPLARLRASHELHELDGSDLRFSALETRTFLQNSLPFALSDEASARLETQTEGWIAGLQIAALALQGRQRSPAVEQFVQGFNGSYRHIVEYLASEVLQSQPAHIQAFLLETSFLNRLTADLCDTVTGKPGSAAVLETLERANLFLVPLDGSQQWYRYHALFAEAMQHYAQRHLGEAHLQALHQRAIDWYEAHGLLEEAVETALNAQAYERAAGLIEHAISLWLVGRELYTLRRWIEALPETLYPDHPLICLLYSTAILFTTDRYAPATRLLLEKPLALAENTWRVEGNGPRLGQALTLRAMAAWWQGNMAEMAAAGGLALELLPENDYFWRSIALGNVGMGEMMAGNIPLAQPMINEARELCNLSYNPYGARAMIYCQAEIALARGDLQQAAQYFREIVASAGDDLTDKSSALFGLAGLAYEWNDLETAEAQATQALEIGTQIGDDPVKIEASMVLARMWFAHGQKAQAVELLNSVIPLARWPLMQRELLGWQARFSLMSGDLTAVQRWHTAQLRTANETTHMQREQEALITARLFIRQGETAEALRLLETWLPDAQEGERTASEIEIRMVSALAHFADEHLARAKKALIEALKLAHAGGYQRLFLNEAEPMAALLKALLPDVSDDPLITYVRSLLYTFTQLGGETHPLSSALAVPLSPQEQRVLHLLAAGLSYPEMAHELVVSVNTIKTQVKSIYRKLNVENREEARDLAQHLKLI